MNQKIKPAVVITGASTGVGRATALLLGRCSRCIDAALNGYPKLVAVNE